jgi:uroporphyrin-III C-methyltransferase
VRLDFDWRGLADPDTTLAVYMGLANIAEIAARLIEHGLDADTPVMAVSRGTTPTERRLVTTLGGVFDDARRADLEGPTLFIIGRVVSLAEELAGVVDGGAEDDAALRA